MLQYLSDSNNSKFQFSEFILLGFPGIHSWQHWLSLPLALLYLLAISANILILIIINQEAALNQPMYHFLGILAVVDMGLATTIMPKILAILWFDAKAISLPECFVQIYVIHSFVGMESGIFVCMAIDRYVAICRPLRYASIVTVSFVIKATVLMTLRNSLFTIPVPVLAAQRHYCFQNQIEHCLCSNLGVTSLSCDDRRINSIYQIILAWIIMGSDLILIILSYALILNSVLKLKSAEAASKALSTCTSHLILILFFYTVLVVISITHSATMTMPLIPVLLNVLHNVIPPALNPMVYALKNKDLRQGLYKVLKLDIKATNLVKMFTFVIFSCIYPVYSLAVVNGKRTREHGYGDSFSRSVRNLWQTSENMMKLLFIIFVVKKASLKRKKYNDAFCLKESRRG